MARPLRIQYEGACYHVINRGLERRNIFLNNKHKKNFLDLLSEITERFNVNIHAYCLMSNHYHLLLTTNLANLDAVMRYLNAVYTLKFNRDVKRDGPLFRGRYKSVIVDREEYFLNVSRYIHKNPSTAKLIKDDQRYVWSSYQYYHLKKFRKPKWLTTDQTLSYFCNNAQSYIDFVESGVDENTKEFYSLKKISPIFGSKSFIKYLSDKFFQKIPDKEISNRGQIVSTKYPSLSEIALKVITKYKIDKSYVLENKARNYVFERSLLIYLFMINPRYSVIEKATFLGISGDGISKSYKRFLNKIRSDSKLANEVEEVRKYVYD